MKAWMQQHRRQLLVIIPALFFFIVLIIYLVTGRYVSTEDAYVQAAKVAISSNVAGQVTEIFVRDNQVVKKGDLLFKLDDRPYKIAVNNAKAQLANARLQIKALKATYKEQLAITKEEENTFIYQEQEFHRQQKLAAASISSQMLLNKATNDLQIAKQQFIAAKQKLDNIFVSLGNDANIPIEEHPIVQQAQARLNEATLNLAYTQITAPINGIVTKVERLQVGDYVKIGAPAFALVSNEDIWVEANYRETDITYIRPGQKATISIDTYPDYKFKGVVVSLSPGTGSTFALLPPENATGNWVKIVQRVPVRISIDTSHLDIMLGSGLSADVTVDTKHGHFSTVDASK